MVEIMNRLRQPLIINLNDGTNVHLLSREITQITIEQFKSKEVKNQLEQGNILILKMS